jgi:hypothetical protein
MRETSPALGDQLSALSSDAAAETIISLRILLADG